MKIQAAIQGFLMDWELRGRSQATLRLYRSCLGGLRAGWRARVSLRRKT